MSIYEFGAFRLDLTDGCLSRAGQFLQLPQKPCEVLALLVQQPGRLVTKEELMTAVWPNIVVEENNLTVSISKIRKVLGENKRRPKYIATLSHRGYRFIAKVKCVSKFDSIVVLPFTAHSSDANAEFPAEVLTETLVYQLKSFSNLRIVPPSSVLEYKEQGIQSIANKFRVQLALSGRLTLAAKSLSVSIELLDIRHKELVWGHRYETTLGHVGLLATEIADNLRNTLRRTFATSHPKPFQRAHLISFTGANSFV